MTMIESGYCSASRHSLDDMLHHLVDGSHRLPCAHLVAQRCIASKMDLSQAECGLHTYQVYSSSGLTKKLYASSGSLPTNHDVYNLAIVWLLQRQLYNNETMIS